ncbi:serine protease 52-like [Rhincodon typus]|uniref:serine protease 52-like n=1 Tax=Rhincodon typus TaxID=259920 RepID=UPI00202DC48E|nr:serine protease 52-like [Rhincodon typus]
MLDVGTFATSKRHLEQYMNRKGCGVPNIKYENNFAREIRPGEFPWQVQLQFNWRYLCGGVILNRWWVLTTAHCVFMFSSELYPNLVVIAGTLQQDDMQIIYNVRKIILHRYFVYDLFRVKIPDHDIALVLVREPFIFNNLVSPICFPDDQHLDMDTVENCWVTGWQLKSLAQGPMPPIYHMVKQNVGHQRLAICEKFYPENLRKNLICVTNWDKKQSLCMGGYGAPLECQDKRTKIWIIAGAASFCKQSCNYTALFTRYSHYLNWVETRTLLAGKPFFPVQMPPKPTLSCKKIRHSVNRNARRKSAGRWERRRKWKKQRHRKVVFGSNLSNSQWDPGQVLPCLALVPLLLGTKLN